MNKSLEAIEARLEALESYKKDVLKKSAANIAATKAEIDALEAELKDADDIDDYKEKQQNLKDARACLEFLKNKEAQQKGSTIPDDEYKKIDKEIREETELLQEKHAPAMLKKVAEIVELLDKYADEADDLERLINKAYMLHEGLNYYTGGGYPIRTACNIKNHGSQGGIFAAIVTIYYNHREAMKRNKDKWSI